MRSRLLPPRLPQKAPARYLIGQYLDCERPMWTNSARPRVPLCAACQETRDLRAKKARLARIEAKAWRQERARHV